MIRADTAQIRYEFAMDGVEAFAWVPGRVSLAGPGTDTDSHLCDALQLLLTTWRLLMAMSNTVSRSADQPLG